MTKGDRGLEQPEQVGVSGVWWDQRDGGEAAGEEAGEVDSGDPWCVSQSFLPTLDYLDSLTG